jgi:DNA primase
MFKDKANEIRQQISLTVLAEEAGAKFDSNRTRSHCPLPLHAGDRSSKSFVIYENGQKWKCHSSCPSDSSGGDVISFYMAWKEVDFKTAVQELSEWTGSQDSKPVPVPAPKQYVQPQKWKERAAEFIAYAEKNLNNAMTEYLIKERGLSPETARAFHVGV